MADCDAGAVDTQDETAGSGRARSLGDRLRRLGVATARRAPQLIATITGGVLLCTSFPPVGWWWAAVLAFALLSWVLIRPATTLAGGLGYGALFGLAFYLPLLPWTADFVGVPPWLVLSAVCSAFPALFGLLAVLVRRVPGWPLAFAVLWAGQEWVKSVFPFGGFPWGVVGFGQADGPLLPLVAMGGVPLLSAAIVLLGCSATAIGVEIVAWWRRPAGSDTGESPPPVALPGAFICVVLLASVVAWPQVHQAGTGSSTVQEITVAVVQGNVPELGLEFNSRRRAVLDNHVKETMKLAEAVHAGARRPQFVVWPENASDIDPLADAAAAEQISLAARMIGAPILVGTVLPAPGRTPDDPASMNTVLVWNPDGRVAGRHDKRIVQPFGEYLPWRGVFVHLSGYADRAGYFVPGDGNGVLYPAGVPVGVATCWEVIFDRAPRESVLAGAQLLVVPTNNATFDETMSRQQLAFAKVRAVEHDRYVVVAGTTGISAVIAPDGRVLAHTEFFEPAYLDTQVGLRTGLTAATRWGPLVQWVLVTAGGAVALGVMLHNGWSMRRRSAAAKTPEGTP